MLTINANDNSPNFTEIRDSLPGKVSYHTLTPFKGKLMLIGGYVSRKKSNAVYEGTMVKNHITWKQVSSLSKGRQGHMTVNVNDQLFVMGGYGEDSCEILEGDTWKIGPYLPYGLGEARVVVDRHNRVLIFGGYNNDKNEYSSKIIIFDPIKLAFKELDDRYQMKEGRFRHVALLQ